VPAGLVVPLRPRMLQVLLGNLLDNALRYAGRGATFRVAARPDGDSILLEVSDDGAGVDASDVPRLFERFFRSDRSRTSRGTGLGLAIVKHIVNAADGTAEVEGALGEGTRFRFVLPGPRVNRIL
jgi:signal transduction histidine kinase